MYCWDPSLFIFRIRFKRSASDRPCEGLGRSNRTLGKGGHGGWLLNKREHKCGGLIC
ncbi:mucolipin 1 (predicted), isoform CRA_b, partial [Rattus norvegicus]